MIVPPPDFLGTFALVVAVTALFFMVVKPLSSRYNHLNLVCITYYIIAIMYTLGLIAISKYIIYNTQRHEGGVYKYTHLVI